MALTLGDAAFDKDFLKEAESDNAVVTCYPMALTLETPPPSSNGPHPW